MLSPVGLASLFVGDWAVAVSLEAHKLPEMKERQVNPQFLQARNQYESLNQFSVTVPNERGGHIRFILERDAYNAPWILTHINLPDPELILSSY